MCRRPNGATGSESTFPRLRARYSKVVRVMTVFSEAGRVLMSGSCRLMGALDMVSEAYADHMTGNMGWFMGAPGLRSTSRYGGDVAHGLTAKRASSPSQRVENPRLRVLIPTVDGAPWTVRI